MLLIRKRTVFIAVLAILLIIPIAAYAGSAFDDVADGSTHAEGIAWMKTSGVSLGCGGNNYCPDDYLTRAQMGSFMYRLSGNDPATPPSVNADKLDGHDSSYFLTTTGKAADSDKLDGLDSTEFLAVTGTAANANRVGGLLPGDIIRVNGSISAFGGGIPAIPVSAGDPVDISANR
jgi:hypothetical protein